MSHPLPPTLQALLSAVDESVRERAWSDFLAEYNKLILHVCHHFAGDYDAVMDHYAFVVEQLRRNESKWLRSTMQMDAGNSRPV